MCQRHLPARRICMRRQFTLFTVRLAVRWQRGLLGRIRRKRMRLQGENSFQIFDLCRNFTKNFFTFLFLGRLQRVCIRRGCATIKLDASTPVCSAMAKRIARTDRTNRTGAARNSAHTLTIAATCATTLPKAWSALAHWIPD